MMFGNTIYNLLGHIEFLQKINSQLHMTSFTFDDLADIMEKAAQFYNVYICADFSRDMYSDLYIFQGMNDQILSV